MEEYHTIEQYPKYQITISGKVRIAKTLKIKSQYIGSTGYYMVSLWLNGKSKPKRVHRLLSIQYIPNPEQKPEVNHKDGNKLNNDLSNLEWMTHSENVKHAFKTGLVNNTGEKNGMSILKESQVIEIKEMLKTGLSQYKISEKFNVSRSCILGIHLGRLWKHV